MASYQLAEPGVIRIADGLRITRDMLEWRGYVAWLKAGNVPEPMPAPQPPALADVQDLTIEKMAAHYQIAIQQPVTYNGHIYQADAQSVANLQASITGCQAAQATPPGFFWVAADNTQVQFGFSDLTALAAVIFAQGATAFARLQIRKAAIRAATTAEEVQAIIW